MLDYKNLIRHPNKVFFCGFVSTLDDVVANENKKYTERRNTNINAIKIKIPNMLNMLEMLETRLVFMVFIVLILCLIFVYMLL